MARYSFFFLLFSLLLIASEIKNNDLNQTLPNDTNTSVIEKQSDDEFEPVIIKDTSGLSEEEIRKKAHQHDKKKPKVKIKDVVDAIDEDGTVKLKRLIQKEWEDLGPTPKDGYDWVRTKYGDWLKGHIKGMFDDKLEFDSQEFGIYTFKLSDLSEIRSYGIMSVNIDNVAIFKGIVRYKDKKITIISGDHSYTFDKRMIISIASAQQREIYNWAFDISLSIDVRSGNNDQTDASLSVNLKRRTPKNRYVFDYLGRYSEVQNEKTAQDSRIDTWYDRFMTKYFFITPIFTEYYQNYFQNIKHQLTIGFGAGYTLYDTPKFDWDLSAGPAFLQTIFHETTNDGGIKDRSASLEARSRLEYKFTPLIKVKFDYKFSITDKKSGTFKHHSDLKFENDLVKDRIYLDLNFIWDYVATPQELEDGTLPLSNDYQVLVGGGIRF